jgi:hypothetical protein
MSGLVWTQDLTLAPVLTVDETFTHAAECLFSEEYIQDHAGSARGVVDAALNLFGMECWEHVVLLTAAAAEIFGFPLCNACRCSVQLSTRLIMYVRMYGALLAAGLSHVANTVVGDAELRGLSGGQKRRVTVGEKAFGDYRGFYYFDEPTNGVQPGLVSFFRPMKIRLLSEHIFFTHRSVIHDRLPNNGSHSST